MTQYRFRYGQGAAEVTGGGYRFTASADPLTPAVQTLEGASMGTGWSVKYWDRLLPSGQTVRHAVEATLQLVIEQMSTWDPTSVLSRFNNARAGSRLDIPGELATVLRHALETAKQSGGAFDPTIGPLVNLWGFGPRDRAHDEARRRPVLEDIAATRARCGYEKIVVEGSDEDAVLIQPGGLYIDLSAIAKGFAVDLIAARLADIGIANCLIDVGGELLARGVKPDGKPWQVAVAAPRAGHANDNAADDPAPLLAVPLRDRAIATSGDHWHFFAEGGREYSHTLDPRTGCPVTHHLASVTVVHESCMQADALATVLTVMGPQAGYDHAARMGVAALFLRRAGAEIEELATPRFSALLK